MLLILLPITTWKIQSNNDCKMCRINFDFENCLHDLFLPIFTVNWNNNATIGIFLNCSFICLFIEKNWDEVIKNKI